ncbi:MAG TPA: SIMPL domain-containing protein [Ornithinicoccus sp.]|nr:SIMPL domain-containing protein [Ornithinicoccus sp.]
MSGDTGPDRVEVVGHGTAAAEPDQAVVSVRVECPADTVAAALAGLRQRVTAVLDAVRDPGPTTTDAVTLGVGVHPRHDRDGAVTGHTAYQTLRVVVGAPDRAGDVVVRLGEAAGDGLHVESVTLEVADETALHRRAREAAFADARQRAELYASLAGRTLGAVHLVSEVLAAEGPGPRFAMAAGDAGLPVQPGAHEVTARLRVTWALD